MYSHISTTKHRFFFFSPSLFFSPISISHVDVVVFVVVVVVVVVVLIETSSHI